MENGQDRTFTIPAEKVREVDHWLETHPCSLRNVDEQTAIGGRITYFFTATSIGEMQNIRCACGASYAVPYDY